MKTGNTPQPPRWAERLLEWLAAPHLLEELQGDLHELFYKRLQKGNASKARLLFVLDLLQLIHPRLWRPSSTYSSPNAITMFRHNLLLTFRSFLRFKGSFAINLIGLSAGLASTLLIYLWVQDELMFDKFHEQDSQLFQILENRKRADGILTSPTTSGPLAASLSAEMPEVAYAATATKPQQATLSVKDKNIRAEGPYVSKDYFKVFSFPFISGNRAQVMADKNAIVISEKLAKSLFNTTENILGKTVEFEHDKVFQITGVFKDIPSNSSIQFDFALSLEKYIAGNAQAASWDNTSPFTYVRLKPGTDPKLFNQKIADYIKVKTENTTTHRTLLVKKFSENYLYGGYENGVQAGGRIDYVKLFSMIALFTLFIACINFMNLSTARASRRLKEVGVKKAIGADRNTLVFQYLSESMLMAFVSMSVSLLLVQFFLPRFNEITGKSLSLHFDPTLISAILLITCVTGLVAGSYPALYLSGLNPIAILKGKSPNSTGEIWIRKGLVVFQFVLSVILIVSVCVVYKQIEFLQTQHLGYTKDNLIDLRREGKMWDKGTLEAFLSEAKAIPGIINVSSMAHSMTGHNTGTSGVEWAGKDPTDRTEFENVAVNYGMIETLEVEIAAGRSFSREYGADSAKIIFNEAAIRFMHLTDPVGKVIKLWGQDMEIIGVVKDFHFESLHERVKPLFIRLAPDHTKFIMARIRAGSEKEVVNHLQKLYTLYNPGFPFDYGFLDEDYQALYAAENRVSILSRYFAGLAILISCLGLFGLAAFTAERRRKEIGIRKVFGSSEVRIIYLLSGEFTRLVLISVCVALPVSYLLIQRWLNTFAFSIDLEWWYFVLAGSLALLIAWITVSIQAIKAAKINPIQSLKQD